jgi:hypothetical protein
LGEFAHDGCYPVGGEVETHQMGGPVDGRLGVDPPTLQRPLIPFDSFFRVRFDADFPQEGPELAGGETGGWFHHPIDHPPGHLGGEMTGPLD